MLILVKTRPRKSSGYIVAILSLTLFACTSTVGLRRQEQAAKFPIPAVLVFDSNFEQQEFRKAFRRTVGPSERTKPFEIVSKVGIGSRALFERGLGYLFEKVDVVRSEEFIPRNAIAFVPAIISFNAGPMEENPVVPTVPTATVEYEVTVKTPGGRHLLKSRGTGTAEPMSPPGRTNTLRLGPLVLEGNLNLPYLGVFEDAFVNAGFTTAFDRALESAFEQLVRDLNSSDWFDAYVKSETERRALPSELATEVAFLDRESLLPNNRLDAGEDAELVVQVKNQGRGSAYGVAFTVSVDLPQINLPGPRELGEIPPGQSRETRLPVKAALDLPDGVANLLIEAKEKRGYDAQKVKLVLPTARLERPSLTVASYEINDGTTGLARGNGNGIPENGETIELLTFVRNTGPGPAAAATLSLSLADRGVDIVQRQFSLGTILPNQTAKGILAFTIPRTYTGTNLNLTLQARDGRGESVGAASRQITVPLTARAPVLAATTRILSGGREIKELTNGQTVEVEVAPRNTGTLDAEQVMVRLSATGSGVSFRQDRELIGTLRAGTAGRPVVFELNIPRTFVNDRLALNVELSQREFSSQSERLDIPVNVRRPALASSFTVAGRQGGRAIEQNETADLEVRVVNTGNLAAEGVTVGIDLKVPGVEVQGPKSVAIGMVPSNGQSLARFKLQVRRSVPVGELPIALSVTQSEFPSVADTLRLDVRPEKVKEVPVVGASPPSSGIAQVQPPIVAIVTPTDGQFVQGEQVEIRGTVVDEKGIQLISISVNGRPVPEDTVGQGLRRQPGSRRDQVELNVRVPLDRGRNTIEVTAYSVSNEQERVSRIVTRLEDQSGPGSAAPGLVALSDVDRYILDRTPVQADRRRWAVIIGIERYRRAPSVLFASRDAIAMREYAVRLLGVPPEQVFLMLDDQATKSEIQVLIEDRLQQRVQPGDIVYVYYAGHGISGIQDGTPTPYLVPADGDPQSLRFSAYSAKDFYGALGKLKAERVLVFLDACFSGLSARQDPPQMLLAGTRPIIVTVEGAFPLSPNVTSFAATEKDQVSNAYKEQAHGLFTYFLLKGLSGAADRNGDGIVTASELAEYVQEQVSRTSRQLFGQNMHQTPIVRPTVDPSRDMRLSER